MLSRESREETLRETTGRSLATLAVGVAIGAGIAIPASALAQGGDGDRQPPASQSQAVDNGGSMRGHDMGSMMSMMRAPADDGSTEAAMKTMARECAQMMRDPAMQRMHQRMRDEGAGPGQMRDSMMGER